MKDAVKIYFKDWLPDQPAFENPGLIEATNVRSYGGRYVPMPSNVSQNTAMSTAPGKFVGHIATEASPEVFAFAVNRGIGVSDLFYGRQSGSSWTVGATQLGLSGLLDYTDLVDWNGTVYVSGRTIGRITTGSLTPTSITAAPVATYLGIINQFLVAGRLQSSTGGMTDTDAVQWSSISNPDDWPTPASSTAVARQSGMQSLGKTWGEVTGISPGDEYGLIFQARATHRMTYIGGDVVFQFNRISDEIGCYDARSIAKVEDKTYFLANTGSFYVTDGINFKDISTGRVKNYFKTNYDVTKNQAVFFGSLTSAVDVDNGNIHWNLSTTASMIYSYVDDRWSFSNATCNGVFYNGRANAYGGKCIINFDGSGTLSALRGTAGAAYITTAEYEANTGGFTRADGVKPLIDGATINAVTVSLGVRNDLGSAASFGSATTANASTGFADFRTESRYQRARLTINGTFNAAIGMEVRQVGTGKR